MIELTIILVGILATVGTLLLLQKGVFSILLGVVLLSNVANLTILIASGSPIGKAEPILKAVGKDFVDPLPQALILTAIVIGFAITCYLIFLLYRYIIDFNGSQDSFYIPEQLESDDEIIVSKEVVTFDGRESEVKK